GPVLRELQEKRPITTSPSEEWHSFAAVGVVQVVRAFGNRRQKICPFASNGEIFILGIGHISKRIPCRPVRLNVAVEQTPLEFLSKMCRRRKSKRPALSMSHDKHALAQLWDAEVCRVENGDVRHVGCLRSEEHTS